MNDLRYGLLDVTDVREFKGSSKALSLAFITTDNSYPGDFLRPDTPLIRCWIHSFRR